MSGTGGRAVIVTGATGGIGRVIARTLAADGDTVIAHYHRDAVGAVELRAEIERAGGTCRLVQADLSDADGPAALAGAVRDALHPFGGQLHGLVNNAALLLGPALEDITADLFDGFFTVNTRAPLLLAKELLPTMPAGSSIVNVSSAAAHLSSPGDLLYAASKTALESMTRNLAAAVAARGVRVNAVVPGYTDNGHAAFQDAATLAYMSSLAPLGGVAAPETVAHAVRFLLSPESGRTTGSLLDVSGGTTLSVRGRGAQTVRDVIPRS